MSGVEGDVYEMYELLMSMIQKCEDILTDNSSKKSAQQEIE